MPAEVANSNPVFNPVVTLQESCAPPGVVLWFRESKRHKWREVGRAATGPQALALMDSSGLRNGLWMRLAAGRDPNEKNPTRSE